ncbi:glucuronide transporter [Kineosporia babensis]|uniref:Glucuronide transporter n=1 Tax=Kineosporia babensis TaxID=499548 RepID=A0A9X1SVS5_9ACTN|nr:glucuronide transporter [Kineosporia babensis]MCD5314322.1 glucuronide transporter [Kineosporia babensis]
MSKLEATPAVAAAGSAARPAPLKLWRFFGYGAGDAANNLAFSMGTMFLLLYYTDVVGLSAAAVGTMFLVVRIWDAFADLAAGRLVDITSTRWGKFRPFILFGSLPLLLLGVAVFAVPEGLSQDGKLIYAYVSYAALGVAYSLVNIPYGSLASAMTQVTEERAKLGAFRAMGSAVTIVLLAFVVSPQLQDAENLGRSLLITTSAFVVLGMALYLFTVKSTREVVQRDVDRVSLKQSLGTLRHNRALVMLCGSALSFLMGLFMLSTVQAYYARDVLGNANYYIVLTLLSVGATFLMGPLLPGLTRRFGKKRLYITAGLVAVVGGIGIVLAPPSQPWMCFVAFGVLGLGTATANTLMWALEADTVEYGEWANGVRTEGTTYAVFSFTRKLGQALGGSAAAYGIGIAGYVAGAGAQSAGTIDGIRWITGLGPALFVGIGVLIMIRYPLTDDVFRKMVQEVAERREARRATEQNS